MADGPVNDTEIMSLLTRLQAEGRLLMCQAITAVKAAELSGHESRAALRLLLSNFTEAQAQ